MDILPPAQALKKLLTDYRTQTQIYPYPVGGKNFTYANWYRAKVEFIYDYYVKNKAQKTLEDFKKDHAGVEPLHSQIERDAIEWCDSDNFLNDWQNVEIEDKKQFILYSPILFSNIRYMIGLEEVKALLCLELPPNIPNFSKIFVLNEEKNYQTQHLQIIEKRKLEQRVASSAKPHKPQKI